MSTNCRELMSSALANLDVDSPSISILSESFLVLASSLSLVASIKRKPSFVSSKRK